MNLNYIELALRTKSDKFYGDRVPLSELRHWIGQAILAARELDKIKKTLFYGKQYEGKEQTFSPNALDFVLNLGGEHSVSVDLLHCIIGKTTESGELLEALAKCMDGDALDHVNFAEEIGDGQWYDAIGLAAVSYSFEDVQDMNIAKLRKRFPDRFTEQQAETRDLDAERAVLETSPGLERDDMAGLRGMTAHAANALIVECAAQAGISDKETEDFKPLGWNLLYRVAEAAHKKGAREREAAMIAAAKPVDGAFTTRRRNSAL